VEVWSVGALYELPSGGAYGAQSNDFVTQGPSECIKLQGQDVKRSKLCHEALEFCPFCSVYSLLIFFGPQARRQKTWQ